jgi:hypothetical protein
VTDHAVHLRVDQLLRHAGGLLRVARVVFGHQLERHLLTGDRGAARVEVFDCHARGVLGVLAKVGHRPGDPGHMADLDDVLA